MKKLSRIDRHKIREAYEDGLTQEELALIFGVDQGRISRIVKKRRDKQDEIADRMEYFLGGATVDDGCYTAPRDKKTPNYLIDNQDPLSILLAEEKINEKIDDDD